MISRFIGENFPNGCIDECGLGIMHGVQPTSGIRETVQDSQGDFCNKLKTTCYEKDNIKRIQFYPEGLSRDLDCGALGLTQLGKYAKNTWESAP